MEGAASFFGFRFKELGTFISSIGSVKREREALLSENIELRAKNALLKNISQENKELREEIGLLPKKQFKLLEGEVIGREASSLNGRVVINVGSRNGVREGMPVIVGKGVLVGRISGVGPISSGVLLLSHPESAVNAIENETQSSGIVRGEYGLGLLFDMVLQTDSIRDGDDVVTSGLGGDVPKGLLIGTVTQKESSLDRLFQRATLVSPVQFDRIHFVSVILGEIELP